MFKLIKGVIFGLVVGAVIGSWLGFNKGRGAPLFTNPFAEHTLTDQLKKDAGVLFDDTKESIKKSLE